MLLSSSGARSKFYLSLLFFLLLLCFTGKNVTAETHPPWLLNPSGIWATEGRKATLHLHLHEGKLYAELADLLEPNDKKTGQPKKDIYNPDPTKRDRLAIGMTVFFGLILKEEGKRRFWTGQAYNAEDGGMYSIEFEPISETSARVRACVRIVVRICPRKEIWTKIKTDS